VIAKIVNVCYQNIAEPLIGKKAHKFGAGFRCRAQSHARQPDRASGAIRTTLAGAELL
jgi:hypothetical protein